MITGRVKKSLKEVCLVDQAFVKDSNMTVAEYVASCAKALGKDIKVVEMVRYEVGEGLAKKEENFAEEVAKQIRGYSAILIETSNSRLIAGSFCILLDKFYACLFFFLKNGI